MSVYYDETRSSSKDSAEVSRTTAGYISVSVTKSSETAWTYTYKITNNSDRTATYSWYTSYESYSGSGTIGPWAKTVTINRPYYYGSVSTGYVYWTFSDQTDYYDTSTNTTTITKQTSS